LSKNRFTYFLRLQRLVTLSINMIDVCGRGGGADSMEFGLEEEEADAADADEYGEYDEQQAACQYTDDVTGSGSGGMEDGSGSEFGDDEEGDGATGHGQSAVDNALKRILW
jgi:hypothetical protein